MPVEALYGGFFRFLDALDQSAEAWSAYRRHYLEPNRAVLDAAWRQCVGLDAEARRARVERVRPEHYAHLRELLAVEDPAPLAGEALNRCRRALDMQDEPTVHLLVGFFSPDGFVFRVGAQWQVGIGLERYKTWRPLPIIVAHEVAHWVRRRLRPHDATTVGDRMVSEGLSVAFSRAVYPERPLREHLHMSPASLRWLGEHERNLWRRVRRRLDAPEPGLLFGPGADVRSGREAPPRSWVYLGYRAVEDFLAEGVAAWPGEGALCADAADVLRI